MSTHVLDVALGRPASGVEVRLFRVGEPAPLAVASTDQDGRVAELGPARLPPGVYRLTFDTGGYFAVTNTPAFYPEVTVTFECGDAAQHYHVPLLLSPFGYSTYRGS